MSEVPRNLQSWRHAAGLDRRCCGSCVHLTRHLTCSTPFEAGLVLEWRIVFMDEWHDGAGCTGWEAWKPSVHVGPPAWLLDWHDFRRKRAA